MSSRVSARTSAGGIGPSEWTNAEQLAKALAPDKAKRIGREWRTLCPAHDDHRPSLDITDRDGKLLFCCRAGCTQEAVIAACWKLGHLSGPGRAAATTTKPARRPTNGISTDKAEIWQPLVPVPADAPKPTDADLHCDVLHEYLDADDRLLCYVRRHEAKPDRRKQFLPLTFGVLTKRGNPPVRGWHTKTPGIPKPLYGLNRLSHASPDATVLLCEGEKATDAAQRMFPDHVAMSWMGGAKAVGYADLTPLAGHRVIVWGDADVPGRDAAARLAEQLPAAVMVNTDGLPIGFDAADLELSDADPDGWIRGRLTSEDSDDTLPLPSTELTEDGLALAFAREHKRQLRYCHDTGKWFLWDGVIWRPERTKLAFSWARQIIRRTVKELPAIKPGTKAAFSRAATAAGVERFARSDRVFAVTAETWDTDPWLLGTPAGTVDLRTGRTRQPRQEDYITKATVCAPADVPECPLWLAFLNQACGGDQEYIRFLRQWCGYNLTGSTREHALLFIHGPGGNGKGVFLITVQNIMGSYARTAAMDTFIEAKGDRHPTDLAALKGARMVCASETELGRAWSETRIKALTGGDRIAARFMRQDFFEFVPEFKLTVIGNHQPVLHNVDEAARRRFNMAPFVHQPPKPDRELVDKLRAEYPAILRWMLDGCLDWQSHELIRPEVVTVSTSDYFREQDVLSQWIDDCCDTTERPPHLADTYASLFSSWRNYALHKGEEPGNVRRFTQAIRRLGYKPIKDEHGIRGRGFLGLRVRVVVYDPGI